MFVEFVLATEAIPVIQTEAGNLEGETVRVGTTTETVGNKIDSGNEGAVYRVKGDPEVVIKAFYETRRPQKEPKVKAMIGNKPQDVTFQNKGFRSIIWPEATVRTESTQSFLGYQMPYKDIDAATPAFEYCNVDLAWSNSEPRERLKTSRNLAIMVHNIHQAGHAMGDFNDKNILIENDYITLIDCDAFHVTEGTTVHDDTVYHPRYSPPEQLGTSLTAVQKADRFCLGVHIFQFLMEGAHPYGATGDDVVDGDWADKIAGNPFPYGETSGDVEPIGELEKKYEQLPAAVRNLFAECFGEGSKSLSWGRPTPMAWIQSFGGLTDYSQDVNFGKLDATGDSAGAAVNGQSGGSTTATPTDENQTLSVPDFGDAGTSSSQPPTGTADETTVPVFNSGNETGASDSPGEGDATTDDDLEVPDFG